MTFSPVFRAVRKRRHAALLLVAIGVLLAPAAAQAQSCTAVTLDPITGDLDFGRLYVSAGLSGTATLNPATGSVSATGRLVAAQAGAPLLIRVTDASADCEFLLTITPASRNFATSFTVVADRISVLEGTLVTGNPGQREWLVRMNGGVARMAVGGVLEMNTSSDLIDSYTATFTISVGPP
jgi:ABC-type transport system substrate-binding protein